jgi:hypothetical protein
MSVTMTVAAAYQNGISVGLCSSRS